MFKKLLAIIIGLSILTYSTAAMGLGDNPPNSPTDPAIVTVAATSPSSTAGSVQSVSVSVTTKNVTDGTAISAQLMDNSGSVSVDGVEPASGIIQSNTAVLSLTIPAGIAAGNYKIRVGIAALNIFDTSAGYVINAGAQPGIASAVASQSDGTAGSTQTVNVKVSTVNVSDGTNVTLQLTDLGGTAISGVNLSKSTINGNYASVDLTIPGTVAAGSYMVRVTVLTATKDIPYTINPQTNNPAIVSVRLSSYSQTQGVEASVNVTVTTANVTNAASVTADLVDSAGNAVAGVTQGTGSIYDNTATIAVKIPATIPAGSYKMKIGVSGISTPDATQNYSVAVPVLGITNISTTGASLGQGSISGNIVISGTSFSPVASENTVQIVDLNGTVIKNAQVTANPSATSLTAAIPADLVQGSYKVKVTVGSQSKVSTKTFTITAPMPDITSISVSEGASLVAGATSGTLTVTGVNFSSRPADNTLALVCGSTEITCVISSASVSQLKAAIPANLTAGTYTVKLSIGGVSDTFDGFTVVMPPKPAAPGKPAADSTTANSVILSWTPIQGAAGYNIYKSTDGTTYTKVNNTPVTDAGYTATGLTAGTTYHYKISAVNAAGESELSQELAITTNGGSNTIPIPPIPPVTPETGDNGSGTEENPPASGETATVLEGSTALTKVTSQVLDEAFKAAAEDNAGVKTATIKIEKIDGADKYSQELPAAPFTEAGAAEKINIETPLAKIVLPDNMFDNIDLGAADDITLSVGTGNISTLKKSVRDALKNKPVIELSASVGSKSISWNNPGAPVAVSIPYTPTSKELKDPEHIVVWYIDGKGNITTIPTGKYNSDTGMVTFTATHFSKYAVAYVSKTFSDLNKVEWARKLIEVLASKSIVTGRTEGAFLPAEAVTRAEFLYFLMNALGLSSEFDSNFSDIKSSDYYYNAIGMAKELGITGGVGNNKFMPDAKITRQDMMALTAHALNMAKKSIAKGSGADLTKFTDKSLVSSYAVEGVASLIKEGLVVGSGSKINPRGNTTRAEAAALIYRIYNKYN